MTRDEVKDRIHADPMPIYSLMEKAKKKVKGQDTFICPFCGNGSGKDGDGINFNPEGKFHCFKCGKSGDGIDIYQQIKSISDFKTALDEVAHLYGLQIEQSKPVDPATLTEDEKQKHLESMARADIRKAQTNQSHPDFIAYLQSREILPEVAIEFGLGYIPDWRNPKVLLDGKTPPPSPRLIIPTSENTYTARDTRLDADIPNFAKDFTKIKVGKAGLFNPAAIKKAVCPIFIVEGEIDALSFYTVGGEAVSIGSTSNTEKFLEEVRKVKSSRNQEPFIIALDNDKAGKEATERLIDGLRNLNIPFFVADTEFLFNGQKDANAALQIDPEEFSRRVHKAERAELDAESNVAHLERLKKEFSNTPEPIPTGFTYLDDLLDGGLLAGLYFFGGVSSSGKTALSMQIIDQVAQSGTDCLVFAAEMSRADLIARSISRETVINGGEDQSLYFTQREIQAGYRFCEFSEGKLENLDTAYLEYSKYANRITIYENKGDNMKPSRIRQKIQRYCHISRSRPLVLIDYLQILTPEDKRQEMRLCIDDTIRDLKAISAEFHLPIIVISSLNRDNYTTPLNFSALKESGNIEYSADYILGLQFSIVHSLDHTKGQQIKNLEILKQEKRKTIRDVEIVILKQRGGKSDGTVKFEYDARHNLYKQSQTVEEYLENNYTDLDERRHHRQLLTGHAVPRDDYTSAIRHISKRAKPI